MRKLLAIALVLTLAACGGGNEDEAASPLQTETEAGARAEPVSVPLTEVAESGQTGEATLSPAAQEGTLVIVTLDQADEEPVEAHLHEGTCAELDDAAGVAFELEPVGQEPAETQLDVTVDKLLETGYALAVHDLEGNHAACGDVAAPGD